MKRNRVTNRDTVKGYAFDKDGNIISGIFDNGYTSIRSIVRALISKAPASCNSAAYMTITNITKEWSTVYRIKNGRHVKSFSGRYIG